MKLFFQMFKPWFSSTLNLIYPQLCLGCNAALLSQENHICLQCELNLPITPYLNNPQGHPVFNVFNGRLHIKFAQSFLTFNKGGISQKLIHELKYRGNTEIGVLLGQLFAQKLLLNQRPEAVVPVPLHPDKEKLRGYNQSYFIALGISHVLKIPVATDLIYRDKKNVSQTKLNRLDRWKNVNGIFKRTSKPNPYQYIWLVDDTLTTGSTLEACGVCFKNESEIGIATLAYAD